METDNNTKVEVQNYIKSINQSSFTLAQVAMIWDFYVTNAIENRPLANNKKDAQSSKTRTVKSYGWDKLPVDEMLKIAGITQENLKILLADSMPSTLKLLDLNIGDKKGERIAIDVDTPRIACLCLYKIVDEGKPSAKEGGKAQTILRHIRNSLAHGRTYFFDNGNLMFEDKNDKSNIITARMILKQQTLLDWIGLIDKEQKYYILHDFCDSCGSKK